MHSCHLFSILSKSLIYFKYIIAKKQEVVDTVALETLLYILFGDLAERLCPNCRGRTSYPMPMLGGSTL
jgi:hypothetical protein